MKEILMAEKEMVFLVLLYLHARWVFFTVLKLYKWYQITQRITENWCKGKLLTPKLCLFK